LDYSASGDTAIAAHETGIMLIIENLYFINFLLVVIGLVWLILAMLVEKIVNYLILKRKHLFIL